MPIVFDLGAIFLSLCAFVVCWCLLQAYSATLGAVIGHLADASKSVTVAGIHVFGWLGAGLDHINHFVMLQLSNAVAGTAYAWHKLVGQLASFISETASVIDALAAASAQAWSYAYRHGIRQLIRVYTDPIGSALHALQAIVRELQHVSHATTHIVTRVVVHDVPKIIHETPRIIEVKIEHAAKAAVGAIGIPLPRIGALERDVSNLEKWVKANQRKLTEAGIAALVIGALSRIGINWTRCANNQKLGKSVCGMNPDALDALLASLLVIASTISVVEFAHECQTFTGDVTVPLRLFVRELKAAPLPTAPAFTSELEAYAAGNF